MSTKACVACAEQIQPEAKICRYCGILQSDERFTDSVFVESDQVNNCWNCNQITTSTSGPCSNCGLELDAEKYVASTSKPSSPMKFVALSIFAVLAVMVVGFFLVKNVNSHSDAGATTNGTDVQGETSQTLTQTALRGSANDVDWSCMAMPNGDTANAYCYIQFALTNTSNAPVSVTDSPFATVDGKIYAVSSSSRFQTWNGSFNPGDTQQSEFYFVLPLKGKIEQLSIANASTPDNPDGTVPTDIVVKITE